MDKYRKLYVSLKNEDELITLFSKESFSDITDMLNEEKFIMLFDLRNGLYLPCALKIDHITVVFRGED
nr:hypothetical protein [Bacillus thuringiensis]